MQEVLKKLQEHDKRFEQVDTRLEQINKRFEQVDKRFDQVDGQIDFIAKKVLDHDEQFQWIRENMATRADISNITNTLDRIVKLAEKKDQELTCVTHDMKDFDDRLEKVEHDVRKMKPALGLS